MKTVMTATVIWALVIPLSVSASAEEQGCLKVRCRRRGRWPLCRSPHNEWRCYRLWCWGGEAP
jgi:hypothetical protein